MGRSRAGIVLLAALGVIVLALAVGGYLLLPHGESILTGVSSSGVALGGLTREEARAALDGPFTRLAGQPITLVAASERREMTLSELGVQPDAEDTVSRAYNVGRQDSIICRLTQAIAVRRQGMAVAPAFTLDQATATGVLDELARAIDRPSTNASAKWEESAKRVVIDPGVSGGKLNIDAALDLLTANTVGRLVAGEPLPSELTLPYDANTPRVTAEMLAPIDTLLSTFTTSYAGSSRNRAGNIDTAARAINGTIVMPGEEFSYNKVVGPRSAEKGFRIAPVIINGQLEPGMGGGVCQVSTTVYNAALLSNMKIVSRSHHSHPVPYVPSGRDATVVYGAIDLKFRNTTDALIVVETKTGGRRLTVRILGKGPAPVVNLERSGIARLRGRTITRKDPKRPLGTRVIEQRGTGGLAVTLTRVVDKGNAGVREVISRDRYIGTPAVIRIGTGPPAVNATGSATVSSMNGMP